MPAAAVQAEITEQVLLVLAAAPQVDTEVEILQFQE
jgi:hypothetical protein